MTTCRQMWHQDVVQAFNVELKPVTIDDLEQLRQWRNSPEIATQMLNQQLISAEQQQLWFNQVCKDRRQIQMVIYYKAQKIGACNIKSLDEHPIANAAAAESGFYLGNPKYRGTMLAFFAAVALNQYCFEQLQLTELLAQVKIDNHAALRFNQQLGYLLAETQPQDALITMRLSKAAHLVAAEKFASYIRN